MCAQCADSRAALTPYHLLHDSGSPLSPMCDRIHAEPKKQKQKTSRAIVVSGNLGASPTFVHAREAVLQHSELVDLAELLEEGPEVLLVQVAGDLTDEEFDGIVVLHGDGSRAAHRAVAVA